MSYSFNSKNLTIYEKFPDSSKTNETEGFALHHHVGNVAYATDATVRCVPTINIQYVQSVRHGDQ